MLYPDRMHIRLRDIVCRANTTTRHKPFTVKLITIYWLKSRRKCVLCCVYDVSDVSIKLYCWIERCEQLISQSEMESIHILWWLYWIASNMRTHYTAIHSRMWKSGTNGDAERKNGRIDYHKWRRRYLCITYNVMRWGRWCGIGGEHIDHRPSQRLWNVDAKINIRINFINYVVISDCCRLIASVTL